MTVNQLGDRSGFRFVGDGPRARHTARDGCVDRFGGNRVREAFEIAKVHRGVEGKVMLRRIIGGACLLGILFVMGACSHHKPQEQALTGEPAHERHERGIASQVGDY
jgi:hypothetical protein